MVLRSCTASSGTLLQPSRPATTIDACYFQAAFGSGGPVANKTKNYPVWVSAPASSLACDAYRPFLTDSLRLQSTHTELSVSGKMVKWGHVFALHLAEPFAVAPVHLPLDVDAAAGDAAMLQWTGWGPTSNITLGGVFDASHPIALPACGKCTRNARLLVFIVLTDSWCLQRRMTFSCITRLRSSRSGSARWHY